MTERDELIYSKLDGLTLLINEKFTENEKSHSAIWEQVRKTNGSVANVMGWKKFIQGGLAVLSIIVVPVCIYVMGQLIVNDLSDHTTASVVQLNSK